MTQGSYLKSTAYTGNAWKFGSPVNREVSIPEQFGNIALASILPNNKRHLVIAADLHKPPYQASRVQANIAKIYLHMAGRYGLSFVSIEGKNGIFDSNVGSPVVRILSDEDIQTNVENMASHDGFEQFRHPAMIGYYAKELGYPIHIAGFDDIEAHALVGEIINEKKPRLDAMLRNGQITESEYKRIDSELRDTAFAAQKRRSISSLEGTIEAMKTQDIDLAMLTTGVDHMFDFFEFLTERDRGVNYYFVEPHGFPQE